VVPDCEFRECLCNGVNPNARGHWRSCIDLTFRDQAQTGSELLERIA
jgi:hypothetical protein